LENELKCGEVILVTMMLVNNETGALYDLATVSAMMRKYQKDAVLHIDATQAFLKVPFSPKTLGADLVTVSSHKVEGPKGVGALYVSDFIRKTKGLSPVLYGGGQEGGFRPGTENVPGICAFGEAVNLSRAEIGQRVRTMLALREQLISMLQERTPEVRLTLPPKSAPHILNITLPSIKSETMLHFLSREGIYVSSGSACSSNGAHRASVALMAYGHSEKEADASLRISFSHHNTEEDIEAFVVALEKGISSLARFER
jgi:cysteine desulfurase